MSDNRQGGVKSSRGGEGVKSRKDDQRTRMTRKLLQKALVDLMREKPLKDITVKALCQQAEVNRSTFYLHYYDIYDLMEELEGQIGAELTAVLEEMPFTLGDQNTFSAYYTAIFALLARHADLCTILLGEHGDKVFVSKLFDMGREKCVTEWMRLYPDAGRKRVEMYYVFVSSGCVGLLQNWFDGGCKEPPEAVARQVERLVATSITTLE